MPMRTSIEPVQRQIRLLEVGIRDGHPDAVPRARALVKQLDGEISALVNRRELVLMQVGHGQLEAVRPSSTSVSGIALVNLPDLAERLTSQIATKAAVMDQIAALLENAAKSARRVQEVGEGPTLESYGRPARIDPIQMLQDKGKITFEQAEAAREIAWVFEEMTKAGMVKIGRMEAAGRAPAGGWRHPEPTNRAWKVYETKFIPWTRMVSRRTYKVTVEIAVDGRSVFRVARRNRLGWNGTIDTLIAGLEAYGEAR